MGKFDMNRVANASNGYQGKFKRVLCVCSAGLLRSPTAAFVLSQEPYNFNTRAAGLVEEFALIPVDKVLLNWADQIVVMTEEQSEEIKEMLKIEDLDTPVICLNIEDSYSYRDPELIEAIKASYDSAKDAKE
jgi:predicted protein tyrosine phosphatase